MLQASLFQEEHPRFQLSHSAFGMKANGLVSPGFLPVSPSVSQCSGVTLNPWFCAQERLGHNQIQAPSSHGKLEEFSARRDTREDSDSGLLQMEKPQPWKLFWEGLSQLSCLEFRGDPPAAQKVNSRFPFSYNEEHKASISFPCSSLTLLSAGHRKP